MTQAELLAKRLSPTYNCAHLASDVWESETGRDIHPILTGFLAMRHSRAIHMHSRTDFERISAPVSPCLVLFRRSRASPHVGVYLRGRVIHLTRSGVMRQSLSSASLGYNSVRFYAVRPPHN